MVEHPEAVAPRKSVIGIIGRPEGNGVHAGLPGHFNGAFNGSAPVVPIEEQIFPLDERTGEAFGVAIVHERLHVLISLFEAAKFLVFLEHFVIHTGDGEKQVACAHRRLAFGVAVQNNAVGGNDDAAIGIPVAEQGKFLPNVGRKKGFAEVEIKNLLQPQIVDKVGHPGQILQAHLALAADEGGAAAVATKAVDVAVHRVLQQHAAVGEPHGGPLGIAGFRRRAGGRGGGCSEAVEKFGRDF